MNAKPLLNLRKALIMLEHYDDIMNMSMSGNRHKKFGDEFFTNTWGLCTQIEIDCDHLYFRDAIDAWRKSEGLPSECNYDYWIDGRWEYQQLNLFKNPKRKRALEFLINYVKNELPKK